MNKDKDAAIALPATAGDYPFVEKKAEDETIYKLIQHRGDKVSF